MADQPPDVLDAVVERLLAGRVALEGAVETVREVAESAEDDVPLRRLGQRLDSTHNVNRVEHIGVLLREAARSYGPAYEGWAQMVLGEKLASLDHPREAILAFEEAVPLLLEGGSPYALLAMCETADCLMRLNDFDGAATVAGAAVTAVRELEHSSLLTIALLVQARALSKLGQHDIALPIVQEAAGLLERLDEREVEEWHVKPLTYYYKVLGEEARFVGRFGEALHAFEAGRRAAMADRDAHNAAWLLSEIGYTWQTAGEVERGARVLAQAAEEAEALGDTASGTHWRQQMSDAVRGDAENSNAKLGRAMAIGQTQPERRDEAIRLVREVIAEASRDDRVLEGRARNILGSLLSEKGHLIQAAYALRVAVGIAQQTGDLGSEFHYRTNLANVFAQRNRLEEGEAELREAIGCGELLRREADSAELRQAVGAGVARAYEQLALNASVSYQPGTAWQASSGTRATPGDPRPPQPLPMIEVGQRLRAQNLLRWIRLGQLVEQSNETLVEPMLALRAADVHLEMAAQDGAPDLGPRMEHRKSCEARFGAAAAAAGFSIEEAPPVYSLSELEAVLEPGELIVELLGLVDGIAITCIGAGGAPSTIMFKSRRKDRLKLMRMWKRALKREALADLNPETSEDARYRQFSGELDQLFLSEIVDEVGKRRETPHRLFVVPHAELFLFPFWRLSEYLPGMVVSVLPTTSALVLLRQRQRVLGGVRVAIGDASGTLPYAARELEWLPRYQTCSPDADALLRSLPEAERVHFSGHGIFDADNPYRSGVQLGSTGGSRRDPLAAPEANGEGELFTVAQIVGCLHLPASHVAVLSGCDTGLPRMHPANEFTSLPAALLIAGSRNVVASIWPAHDGATALLMRELYQILELDDGARPSVALAEARRRLALIPRDEAVKRLGGDLFVPHRDLPFAASIYTDTFQHYGVD